MSDPAKPPRVIKIGSREFRLPQSRILRTIIGFLLIFGGILGFLPILGYWMIPLGIVILSHDYSVVRRFKRRAHVKIVNWWRARKGNARLRGRHAQKNSSKDS